MCCLTMTQKLIKSSVIKANALGLILSDCSLNEIQFSDIYCCISNLHLYFFVVTCEKITNRLCHSSHRFIICTCTVKL